LSFGGYGLALAALALVVFGAIECPPNSTSLVSDFIQPSRGIKKPNLVNFNTERKNPVLGQSIPVLG